MMHSCVRRHAEHDTATYTAADGSSKYRMNMERLREFERLLDDPSRRVRCHWLYDKFLTFRHGFSGHPGLLADEHAMMEEARAEARAQAASGSRHGRRGLIPLFSAPTAIPRGPAEYESDSSPSAAAAVGASDEDDLVPDEADPPVEEREGSLASLASEGMTVAERVSAVLQDHASSPSPLPISLYSPFGHGTNHHYERTVGNNLHKIGVPCLVLLAEDDPLMPPCFTEMLRTAAHANPNLIFAETHRGGHCAWHEGLLPVGSSYAEKLSVSFLAAVLAAESHTTFIVDVMKRASVVRRVRSAVM
jgi:pimeloyl-ACP methyl ester carboxylesterase